MKRNRRKEPVKEPSPKAKTSTTVTPESKKPKLLSTRSPFALAFGSAAAKDSDDSDEDDDFNDVNKKSAEQSWDEIMKEKPDKPLKLRNLTKTKKPKEPEKDPFDDEFGLGDDEPQVSLSQPKIDARVKEKIDEPNEAKDKKTKGGGREKRFFKGKREEPKYVIPSFGDEQQQQQQPVFKMPTVPTIDDQNEPDVAIPEATRLTDEAAKEKEFADDLRYYLDGLKEGATDINLRALSALGLAKKCQDEEFRAFLGAKKLGPKNKAHNIGEFIN